MPGAWVFHEWRFEWSPAHLRLPLRALSIRQPWAELILRGCKTLEVRSRPTRVRGWVQIYAALGRKDGPHPRRAALQYGLDLETLPRGLLVGWVEIVDCRRVGPADSDEACFPIPEESQLYGWVVRHPGRLAVPTVPNSQPQPSFFFLKESAPGLDWRLPGSRSL